MIFLYILEAFCIIPLTMLWNAANRNQIDEDSAITIGIIYCVAASVINWFLGAAFSVGPMLSITSGFYEGDWNIIGLIIAITIPITSLAVSYILFWVSLIIKRRH